MKSVGIMWIIAVNHHKVMKIIKKLCKPSKSHENHQKVDQNHRKSMKTIKKP